MTTIKKRKKPPVNTLVDLTAPPPKLDVADFQWEGPKRLLSSIWDTAAKEDIGAGFRPANKKVRQRLMARAAQAALQKEADFMGNVPKKDRAAAEAERHMRNYKDINRHPFLNGNNPFVFYQLRVDMSAIAKRAKDKRDAPKKVNYSNPIPELEKKGFTQKLKSNIDRTTEFLWKDVLPVTNSLMSAVQRVDDFAQQTFDEKSGVDHHYMKRKMMDAVHLRMIRHIADSFQLTKDERKLFTSEFRVKVGSIL